MNNDTCPPVTVSRTIAAPVEKLFDFVIHTANHPVMDGSGMLVAAESDEVLAQVGDVFVMRMHNDELGDYEMSNRVVEYEHNRCIGWEPSLKWSSRPEDQADIGNSAQQRWGFEFTPVDSSSTQVTEIFDCSRSPEWLRTATRGGERWIESMTATLAKMEALSTD